jgi:membrane peptidoglycan carboxypeptidase
MVEAVWGRLIPIGRRHQRDPGRWIRWLLRVAAMLRWAAALAVCFLLGWGIATEVRTSYLQSRLLSRWAADMKFTVQPGPSEDIRFPRSGPYDERLGYARLPSFIEALSARHFAVAQQARWSPPLERFVDQGGYPIYGEKSRAGVKLFDRDQNPLYQASYPERVYKDFSSTPPLVVDSLLFIEDHGLLDLQDPERNPAVEWGRFMLAAAGRIASVVDRRFREGGASTLATQIEKFRHSPGGRTPGISEKFRQMVTASARAYRNGRQTAAARRDIVTTYLDSTPLGSRPGYGEASRRPCGSGTAPISPKRTEC